MMMQRINTHTDYLCLQNTQAYHCLPAEYAEAYQ